MILDRPTPGRQLWKTDGTAEGTVLVKAGLGAVEDLTDAGGTLFFHTDTKLWKSDGTPGGTVLVSDLAAAAGATIPSSSRENALTSLGGTVFFTASDRTHGAELWKSDGTAAGTGMVKDIYTAPSGVQSSTPRSITAFNGAVYFAATDATHGYELWRSDGTAAGTTMVRDLYPGSSGSGPQYLTAAAGSLFFTAREALPGPVKLWKTDGTPGGTVTFKDVVPSGTTFISGSFVGDADRLFFHMNGALWTSDGTPDGTVVLKSGIGGLGAPLKMIGGTVFAGVGGYDFHDQLWKSDGTVDGTVMLGALPGPDDSDTISHFVNVGGTLYLNSERHLYRSDGTPSGTVSAQDIYAYTDRSFPMTFTAVGNTAYFVVEGKADGIGGLWKSDGTEAGTVHVHGFLVDGDGGPWGLTASGGKLYFNGGDPVSDRAQLWVSDGTEAGTHVVRRFYDPEFNFPSGLTDAGGTLYFTVNDGVVGRELWKTDGTEAGTVLVKDVAPGPTGASIYDLAAIGSTLYFYTSPSGGPARLWKTDGTEAGTVELAQFPTMYDYASPLLTPVGSELYFVAADASRNNRLWKTDGTAAGTVMLPGIYNPAKLTTAGDALYFTAGLSGVGTALFRSADTPDGYALVTTKAVPTTLVYSNGSVYFTAQYSRLWKVDPASTDGITLINEGNVTNGSNELVDVDGTLYFPGYGKAPGDDLGIELWQSDGTPQGTRQAQDIWPGRRSGNPYQLANIGGTLFFQADDGVHAAEPWVIRPPQRPDLAPTLFTGATRMTPGSSAAAVVRVTNRGRAATPPLYDVALVLSTDEVFDAADMTLATISSRGVRLRPGRTRLSLARYTLPQDIAAGTYYLLAVADPAGRVRESDESNNTAASRPFEVAAAGPAPGFALAAARKRLGSSVTSDLLDSPKAG